MLKDRLVKLRKEKKKTQEEVSKVIGVSRPAYTAYEKGNRTPDYDILESLADYFEVTTDYLLGRTDKTNNETDAEIEKIMNDPNTNLMFKDWKNMTDEQREEALNMIKYIIYKDKKGE